MLLLALCGDLHNIANRPLCRSLVPVNTHISHLIKLYGVCQGIGKQKSTRCKSPLNPHSNAFRRDCACNHPCPKRMTQPMGGRLSKFQELIEG